MLRVVFLNRFRDAQCGFKAIRSDIGRLLLPEVRDNAWFFDSELLLRAEQRGWRIWEIPVEWIEDLDSRVRIWNTAIEDLKGLLRVRFSRIPG